MNLKSRPRMRNLLQKHEHVALPLISILFSFVVCGFIILMLGENPLEVYRIFFYYSLFSVDGIGYTLFYATPLIFTGLSVAFCFRCGLFNIGAEGQLNVGTVCGTLFLLYATDLPAVVAIPSAMVVGFLAGGVWGAIPGILKATVGAHEVINTIMMNFIAYGIINYLIVGPFRRKNDQVLESEYIAEKFRILRLSDIIPGMSDNVPLNAGFFLGLVACVCVYIFMWKTSWGFEMRSVGSNQAVSANVGINVKKNCVLSMFIGGGLSGLIVVHEVMGYRYTFHDNFSNGVGFVGIAVALLGRNHPFGIVPAALLFGMLSRGGLFLDIHFDNLSADLVTTLQGIIVLSVAMDRLFRRMLFPKTSTKSV